MNKLINIAVELGKFELLIFCAVHNLCNCTDEQIPYILANMIFLWSELEKEKKKYMSRPIPVVYGPSTWCFLEE